MKKNKNIQSDGFVKKRKQFPKASFQTAIKSSNFYPMETNEMHENNNTQECSFHYRFDKKCPKKAWKSIINDL